MEKNIYRLENETKLFIIHYNGDSYDIVFGSKNGKVSKERRQPLEGKQGRTTIQEALFQVAKQINSKLTSGYVAVRGENNQYGSVQELNSAVEKINISSKEIKIVENKLTQAKNRLQKIEPIYKLQLSVVNDLTQKLKELEAIVNS